MDHDTSVGRLRMPAAEGQRVPARTGLRADVPRWRQVLPGEERQLGPLRRWVASVLPDCPARDDVISVASELAANAVRHTASGRGGWFAIEITRHASIVRVAVADQGGPGEPRVIEDPDADYGRGLLMVRALSLWIGVSGGRRGRLVWADVAFDRLDGAVVASPGPCEAAVRQQPGAGIRVPAPGAAGPLRRTGRGGGD